MGKPVTTRAFLLQLNLMYSAQVLSILIFGGFAYMQSSNIQQSEEDAFINIMTFIVPAALLAGLVAGYFIFKVQLSRITPQASLQQKLKSYQVAVIIRSACLEVPALLGCVATFATGTTVFLYYSAALLFVFFLLRPTADSICVDLSLTHERNLLSDPNAVLYEL